MANLVGMQVSFGSTGDCSDNSAMETFWSTLQREITWIRGSISFETHHDARLYRFEFIEVFDNRQRHQVALGHRTPAKYASTFSPSPPRPVSSRAGQGHIVGSVREMVRSAQSQSGVGACPIPVEERFFEEEP